MRNTIQRSLWLCAALFFNSLITNVYAQDALTIRQEMESGIKAFEVAFNAADEAALEKFYTADAMCIKKDGSVMRGEAVIAAHYTSLLKKMKSQLTLTVEDVLSLSDDYAFCTGFSTLEFEYDLQECTGKSYFKDQYCRLLKKVEGEWVIVREVAMTMKE